MPGKSWHLDRRTFLRGTGVSLALPLLSSMVGADDKAAVDRPRRMCSVFFPYGVSLAPAGHEDRQWNWYPEGGGTDFEFTNTLESLTPLKSDVTVFEGLSHPGGRVMGGHDTGDIFLTGASFVGQNYQNSISIDQVVASQNRNQTRFPSLVLSSDEGIGEPARTFTLSFDRGGRPIPALAKPSQIFARLFGQESSAEEQGRRLKSSKSMLDLMLEYSRSLHRQLGSRDQQKLDEYMTSVREIEQRVARSQSWLDVPKPKVDPDTVDLSASPDGPKEYIETMYDLIYLAFQSDLTRVATYMLGCVSGAVSIANAFPACIGLSGNHHGLAHGAGKKGGREKLGRWDQFLAQQLMRFLSRLKETKEGDGNMLDHTLVFYGSSNSRTHNNTNYPLLLAGGTKLGVQQGQYLKYSAKTPLANLFVTMLDCMGTPVQSFADSDGRLSELIA